MKYRICFNQAPHADDWWEVEYESAHWIFWKKWTPVMCPLMGCVSLFFVIKRFVSKDDAQAWVNEAKRDRVHECGAAQ